MLLSCDIILILLLLNVSMAFYLYGRKTRCMCMQCIRMLFSLYACLLYMKGYNMAMSMCMYVPGRRGRALCMSSACMKPGSMVCGSVANEYSVWKYVCLVCGVSLLMLVEYALHYRSMPVEGRVAGRRAPLPYAICTAMAFAKPYACHAGK